MHPIIDASLPALQVGFDLATISEQLRPLWRAQSATPPVVTGAQLLDHKPGQRALIQYQVVIEGVSPNTFFAKLYSDPAQARHVAENTRWLWDHVFGQCPALGIPQPLGLLPALGMVVYRPVEGQFLDELLSSSQATRWLAHTGAWLATLHSQPLAPAKRFQFATELPNLTRWATQVVQNYPETRDAVAHLVDFLHVQATRLPFATDILIHKDFHYGHVIINGKLHVIDFDEVRLGDPNFDLAHFCANWQLLAWRKRSDPDHLAALQHAFLTAYAHQTGWVQDGRFAYFFAYTCLKLAWQFCRDAGPTPRPTSAARQQEIQLILARGVAALTG